MDELRPPAPRALPPERLDARRTHLVGELHLEIERGRRRRRRAMLIAVPAVLLALAATGFTTYALTREPAHLESIGCFDRAALEANTSVVSADGRHPVEICREVWASGGVGPVEPPATLAACVLESGAVGVFPGGSETCARLGLADLPASYARDAKRFAALRDALVAKIGQPGSGSSLPTGPCVGERAARAIVREELDERGFGDWSVEVTAPFSDARPCASLGFDGAEKIVYVIPAERPPGS